MRRGQITWAVTLSALLVSSACTSDPAAAARAYVESGDRYAAAGKNAEAIVEYRSAVQRDPRAADARAKLAEALLRAGDLANGLLEYVRAADLLPQDANLQMKASSLLLLAGRFDDAKARAEELLMQDPRNVEALIVVANALAGLKDVDAAVGQIEDALRVDATRSGTYSSLGALELSRGKRDAAEQAFSKAVSLKPESFAAQLALANFHWLTGRLPEAEASFNRALSNDPRNPLTNRALANFYLATNRRGEAERPLKTVLEVTNTAESAFALGEYYTAMGNDAAARAILMPVLSDPRASATANVRLAALDYKSGSHDEAYKRLAGVLAKDPASLQALLLKSAFLASDGKTDEALASASTAAQRHPDSTAALFMLGRVQTARKQPAAAIVAFQEVLRLNPRATDAKVALAQLNLAQGKPDASIGFATEALANEPENGNAQLIFVRGLLARGELERAGGELTQLVARYPDSAVVRTQMGMLLGRKRQYEAARGEFEHAIKLQPAGIEALAGLVTLDLASKNPGAARARIDARIAAGPTAPLLALAAHTYAATGDLPSAELFLRQAIELDSRLLSAYSALGQLYMTQGKLAAARKEFEALAERSPKSVAALTMAGIILQGEGDLNGARARFERVLQIDPEAAVAANNLAWIYAEQGGNLDVALRLAQTSQKQLSELAEVNDTLGYIYYKKNLASLAVSAFKVSAEKDPGNSTYHYHLGLAYASAGDVARARQSLSRALALKPDFDGAPQAKELLSSLASR